MNPSLLSWERGTRLTDAQWARIEPLLPRRKRREDGRGRPWRDSRFVLEGILWVLVSGARWKDLPRSEYPPHQTCYHGSARATSAYFPTRRPLV